LRQRAQFYLWKKSAIADLQSVVAVFFEQLREYSKFAGIQRRIF